MKSMLVIGMGRFGRHLATKLIELGNDVMVIDKDEKIINDIAGSFTDAYAGDCTNEKIIASLGINNFDVCFVTIGDNFQSSLEITSLLKEYGAKYIVSKATIDMQAKFLKQIGANEVVYPERDMAERLAIRLNANNVFDYIEITGDYAMYETPIVNDWIGRTILEINVRKNYKINIIAIKKGEAIVTSPAAEYVFEANDHIMFIATKADLKKLSKAMK